MSEEIVKSEENKPAVVNATGIDGLIGFDMVDMPMPYVKLVHPTSGNVDLVDGKEATPGTFYFSQSKTAVESFDAVILFAKKDHITWKEEKGPEMVYRVLAIDWSNRATEPFEMLITGASRWEWKSLLGLLKQGGIKSVRNNVVKISSERRESKKEGVGKYFAMKFELGVALEGEDKAAIDQFAIDFASVAAAQSERIVSEEVVNSADIPF